MIYSGICLPKPEQKARAKGQKTVKMKNGGRCRIRTCDIFDVNDALYR